MENAIRFKSQTYFLEFSDEILYATETAKDAPSFLSSKIG